MIRSTGGRVSERRREGGWPRIYRMRPGQRLVFGGLGLATVVGGLVAAGAILLEASKSDVAFALIPIVFVGIGACLLVAIKAGRIALYEDAIELVELGPA